jgi:hypothetical protein
LAATRRSSSTSSCGVCRVSVETTAVVEAMKSAER